MLLREIYAKNKIVKSFELFPPKKELEFNKLYETIDDLKSLNPDFVSVTYGAGGGTRDKTVEIASTIKNKMGIETVAHFTCVNSSKEDIKTVLDQLKNNNIKNILALRGDPPLNQENITKKVGGFEYASDLVKFIKSYGDWSIAVAGYPESHPDSKNLDEDINFLKNKVDNGADLIITQLFFDNNAYYKFRDKAVKKGIKIPIIPGIIPILNFKAIQKIISLSNATIPQDLYKKLEKVQDSQEETEKIGINYAIQQIDDLLKNEVKGIHFYTMNKSSQIKEIFNALK